MLVEMCITDNRCNIIIIIVCCVYTLKWGMWKTGKISELKMDNGMGNQ